MQGEKNLTHLVIRQATVGYQGPMRFQYSTMDSYYMNLDLRYTYLTLLDLPDLSQGF